MPSYRMLADGLVAAFGCMKGSRMGESKWSGVNLRLDLCPRDSEFADAATPAKIGTTFTTFMSILSPKSTICSFGKIRIKYGIFTLLLVEELARYRIQVLVAQ